MPLTDVAWENWTKRSPPPLTARSVAALKREGVEAGELIYRPMEFFSGAPGMAPEHVHRIYEYHEAKRRELLEQVMRTRDRLVESEEDGGRPGPHEGSRTVAESQTSVSKARTGSVFSMAQSVEHISSVEKEEQKVAEQRRRQQQYVEQMLLYEIRMQQMQAEMLDKIEAERRRDEERRQAEMEEQRRLTEQRRREELERDQKFKEQMAQKKALAVEMFEEERRRLAAEAEAEKRRRREALQLQKERQQKQEEFRAGIEGKFEEQRARVQAMHHRLQHKDALRRQAVAEQRAQAAAEAAERQRRKMERVRAAREQLESIHAERKRRFDEREAKENGQMARFEASQAQWRQEARKRAEERSREIADAMARNEEFLERRRQTILDKEAQAMEAMARANAERRSELDRQMVERQLKLADRLYNVERRRRQDEFRKEQILEKIEYGAWRTSTMNSQKAALEELRRRNRDGAAMMKEAIGESMHQMKITKRFELPAVFKEGGISSPELKALLDERDRSKAGSTHRSASQSQAGASPSKSLDPDRSLSPIQDAGEEAAFGPGAEQPSLDDSAYSGAGMAASASTGALPPQQHRDGAGAGGGMRRSQSEVPRRQQQQQQGAGGRLVAPPPVRVAVDRRPYTDSPLGPVPATSGAPGYSGAISYAAYGAYGAEGGPSATPFQPAAGSQNMGKTWSIYSWPRQQIEQMKRRAKEEKARSKRAAQGRKKRQHAGDLENDNTYFIEPPLDEESGGEGSGGEGEVEGGGAVIMDALTHRRRAAAEEERRQRDEEERRYREATAYLDEQEAALQRELAEEQAAVVAELRAQAAQAQAEAGGNGLLRGFGPYEGEEDASPGPSPTAAAAAAASGSASASGAGAGSAGAGAGGAKKKGAPAPVKAPAGVPPLAGAKGKHGGLSPGYEEQSTPSSVLPQDDEYEAVPFEAFESDQDYTRWSRESAQGRAAGLVGTEPPPTPPAPRTPWSPPPPPAPRAAPGPTRSAQHGHVHITPIPSVVSPTGAPVGRAAPLALVHADRPHAAKKRSPAKRAASFTSAGSHDEGAGTHKSWKESSKKKLLDIAEDGEEAGHGGPSEGGAQGGEEDPFRPKSAPGKFFEASLAPKPPQLARRSAKRGQDAELGDARVRDSVFAGGPAAPPAPAPPPSTRPRARPRARGGARGGCGGGGGVGGADEYADEGFEAAEAHAEEAAAAAEQQHPSSATALPSTARAAAAATEAAEAAVVEAARLAAEEGIA
eukprot:tig00000754_g3911.t1